MKRIVLWISFSLLSLTVSAQPGMLSLDGYRIPLNEEGAVIGRLLVPDPVNAAITDDKSGLFTIDTNGTVRLAEGKSISPGAPISYRITVSYNGEQKEFELVKDEFIRNKVVAHRGAWKHYDVHQNSLGSLGHAIRLGCEASEFDVWLSRDKRVVLNHDHEINGLVVEETDLAEMRKITLEGGEVMPTLEEYIELVKSQNRTRLVLEVKSLKNDKSIELADSCVRIVHRLGAQAWVDYISFDYDVLLRIRQLDAGAHLAYLGADRPLDLQKVEGMSGIDYHFSQFDKIERMYDRCRALGFTVNIWTVNDGKLMEELLDLGVDWITTDEPELLLKLIEQRER